MNHPTHSQRSTPQTLVIPPVSTGGGSRLPASANGSVVGLGDVLFVLRRWWWRCTLLGLPLAVVAGAVVWFSFVPLYEATALLEIKRTPQHVVFDVHNSSQAFAQTQLEIIRSPIIFSKVATDPEVASLPEAQKVGSPIDWLRGGLRANYVNESELCQISFRSRDPQASAKVANAVLEAYLSLYKDSTNRQTDQIVKVLSLEAERRKPELEQLKERVRLLIKQKTGLEPVALNGKEVTMGQSPLAGMEERRTAAEVERVMLEAKLKAYQEAMAVDSLELPAEDLNEALDEHAEIHALQANVAVAKTRLAEYSKMLPKGPRDPSVQRSLEKQAEEVRLAELALESTIASLRPKLVQQAEAAYRARQEKLLSDTKAAIENQQIAEGVWNRQIEEERQRLAKMGEGSLDVEFARDELERAEAVYQKIMERMTVLRTEMRAPPQADIMQKALVPEAPLEAAPLRKCGLAFAGAFLFPFGLAFGWERLVRRISSAEQLGSEVSLPVLGEVTALPARWMVPGLRSNERFLRDRITFEESIESLRLGLTLAPDLKDLQIVAVTSAVSQEGKTSVATALAVSVARCTQDATLLIDADMRAPNIHEMFGLSLEPGLAEILEGTCTLDEAIVVKGLGVHVLPAGVLKVSPHVAMKDGAFAALLEQLREKYRYVIIDAPPVLAASEALLIASAADGSLVCTMRDRSRMPQLRSACQRLMGAGARLVGSVISGVPTRDWIHKYGNYGYAYGWDRYSEAGARWSEPVTVVSGEVVAESSGPNRAGGNGREERTSGK